MSSLHQTIHVSPQQRIRDEVYRLKRYTCPYCNGYGYFQSEQIALDKYKENPCPDCNGTGSLDAEVTIKWLPSTNKE